MSMGVERPGPGCGERRTGAADSGRRWRTRLTLTLLLVLCLAPWPAWANQADPDREQQAQQAERELARLRAEINELKAELSLGESREAAGVAALAEAERAVSDQQRLLAQIDERIAGQRLELDALHERQQQVQGNLQQQQAALAAVLRLSHARSRQASTRLLLDPEQVPVLARTLGYGRALQRSRLARINQYRGTLAQLAQLAGARADALAGLEQEQAQATAARDALAAAINQREAALDSLRLALGDQRRQLAALDRDERQLDALLERLRDIFADLPEDLDGSQAFAQQRGRLDWPAPGRVERSDSGGLHIAAEQGAPVQAIAYGRVAYADWLKGYGLLLIIDHGDGYMSLYGHNDALLQAEGNWVQAGQVISRAGRSGGQAQPGLYFELRERGRAIDPRPWLRPR